MCLVLIGEPTRALEVVSRRDAYALDFQDGSEIRALAYLSLGEMDQARGLVKAHGRRAATGRDIAESDDSLLLLAALAHAEGDDQIARDLMSGMGLERGLATIAFAGDLANRLGMLDELQEQRRRMRRAASRRTTGSRHRNNHSPPSAPSSLAEVGADAPGGLRATRRSRVSLMKVDTGIMAGALEDIATRSRELEELGYDGLITAETGSDPFLPLVIAAEHTKRIELGTGIAVAFARTPMLTAYTANDLQRHSKGRFFLGLGFADQAAHRDGASRCRGRTRRHACASTSSRCGRSGRRGRRLEARLPRRLLHAHADDAVLQPRPEPVRPAEGVPRRGRRADDRGGGRGRRRRDHPRLHDRAVREGGHDARDRAGAREGRPLTRRLRDVGPAVRRHRHERGGVRDGQAGGAAAGRVLRLDARVPARCSSCTAGAISSPSSTRCRSRASG